MDNILKAISSDKPLSAKAAADHLTSIESILESYIKDSVENADWHDVVRTTCYLADMRDYDAFNEVRNAFYDQEGLDPFPAATCVEARICRPELLIEMEAIAVIPADRKP